MLDEVPKRILVVDDNPAIHEDIRKILAPPGESKRLLDNLASDLFESNSELPALTTTFEVHSALQGQQALEMVRTEAAAGRHYAMAFVDVRMPPGWDGVETIERIWQVDPSLHVVLCTAYSDHMWKEMSKRLSHLERWLVLKKPFDSVEVLQVTHALADKAKIARQLSRQLEDLELRVAERTRELLELNQQLSHEVTERRLAEDNLRHMATHDSLTGIANRLLLRDHCELAIARARRSKSMVAMLLLDLDRFKEVNDNIGHDAGDALLKAVASRLCKCARESDTVARLGGDEFVVLLSDLVDEQGAMVVAERILKSFKAPVQFRDHELSIQSSVGVCLYPRDAEDLEGLLRCSDVAMYEAKTSGRGQARVYHPGVASRQSEYASLRDDLREAVQDPKGAQFFLLYQPLVDLNDGRIVGMEALVRWRHPRFGVLEAGRFLAMAEEIGGLGAIGKFVLQAACRQNVAWQKAGFPSLPIGVNVSAMELEQPGYVEHVASVLRDTGLAAKYLELEINENTAARDKRRASEVLSGLSALGINIVIDDFGSGFASMHLLRELPISALKVDRLFVKNMTADARDAGIITAILGFAHALGIPVVAEGIETPEQLRALASLRPPSDERPRCAQGQGYLFSRPVSVEEAGRLLAAGTMAVVQDSHAGGVARGTA